MFFMHNFGPTRRKELLKLLGLSETSSVMVGTTYLHIRPLTRDIICQLFGPPRGHKAHGIDVALILVIHGHSRPLADITNHRLLVLAFIDINGSLISSEKSFTIPSALSYNYTCLWNWSPTDDVTGQWHALARWRSGSDNLNVCSWQPRFIALVHCMFIHCTCTCYRKKNIGKMFVSVFRSYFCQQWTHFS